MASIDNPRQLSDAHKAAISAGQISRFKQNVLEEGKTPDTKMCTKCGKRKRVPEDYVMRRRVLKSGEIRHYPAGECRMCGRERAEQWKQDFIATHGVDAWKAKAASYDAKSRAKRGTEDLRRYNREYQTSRRREAGVSVRGAWKKYRREERVLFSSADILSWIDSAGLSTFPLCDSSAARIKFGLVHEGAQTVTLHGLDILLTAYGRQDALTLFTPLKETDA